jgi:hypothetical protein
MSLCVNIFYLVKLVGDMLDRCKRLIDLCSLVDGYEEMLFG